MNRKLMTRYPLKRVVPVADWELRNVGNLEDLDKLQALLKADGPDVELQ